ncbi:hypothetical protein L7F22_049592 [Adiantum nelumboides]|nr:hypothetical protein [Adiantum nelumboides]
MVMATDVEGELNGGPFVRTYVTGNVAVGATPSSNLIALIEVQRGEKDDTDRINNHLAAVNRRLAPWARIARHNLLVVDVLPITGKGSLHRKLAAASFTEEIARLRSLCARRAVLDGLAIILGEEVSTSDPLWSLALSSNQIAALNAYIARTTAVTIPIAIFSTVEVVIDLQDEVAKRVLEGNHGPSRKASRRNVGGTSTDARPASVAIRVSPCACLAESQPRTTYGRLFWDAGFFRIAEEEAVYVKPQQRLALELCYEALQDALIRPVDLKGKRVGVFCAADSLDGYEMELKKGLGHSGPDNKFWGHGVTGASLPGRISHFFGFEGPSTMIETACSASLVALHAAQRSLLYGDCDLALVGGISTSLNPDHPVYMLASNMASRTGVSFAFGRDADGMLPADGAVFVVIQRTADVEREGAADIVHSFLDSIQTCHQGSSSNMAMTRSDAQHRLHLDVLSAARIKPSDVGLIEAHGTGTRLGDGVEARAIALTFGAEPRTSPFFVSSSKTVFGHTFEAAGLLGVAKAAMCLERGVVPPHHVVAMEDEYDFARLSGVVPHAVTRMPAPLYALTCSFGFSGIMAASVIRRSEGRQSALCTPTLDLPNVLFLSATDESRLIDLARACREYLEQHGCTQDALGALQSTINAGRDMFTIRRAIYAQIQHFSDPSPYEAGRRMSAALQKFVEEGSGMKRVTRSRFCASGGIVIQFSGVGALKVGVARDLFLGVRAYRDAFLEAAAVFQEQEPTLDIVQILYPASEAYGRASEAALQDTRNAQPCQFCVSYAQFRALKLHLGNIDAVFGHSFGEIVAACASGLLTLSQACELVLLRSKACASAWYSSTQRQGAMKAVRASREVVEASIARLDHCEVNVAAVNDIDAVTVSGPLDELKRLHKELVAIGISSRDLQTHSIAFHHSRLDVHSEAISRWQERQPPTGRGNIKRNNPTFFSCSSDDTDCLPDWRRHLVEPVEYYRTVSRVTDKIKPMKVIEIGLASELTSLCKRNSSKKKEVRSNFRVGAEEQFLSTHSPDGTSLFSETLGSLHESGFTVLWPGSLKRANIRQSIWSKKCHWPLPIGRVSPCDWYRVRETRDFVVLQSTIEASSLEMDAGGLLRHCERAVAFERGSTPLLHSVETFSCRLQGMLELRARIALGSAVSNLAMMVRPAGCSKESGWQLVIEACINFDQDSDAALARATDSVTTVSPATTACPTPFLEYGFSTMSQRKSVGSEAQWRSTRGALIGQDKEPFEISASTHPVGKLVGSLLWLGIDSSSLDSCSTHARLPAHLSSSWLSGDGELRATYTHRS